MLSNQGLVCFPFPPHFHFFQLCFAVSRAIYKIISLSAGCTLDSCASYFYKQCVLVRLLCVCVLKTPQKGLYMNMNKSYICSCTWYDKSHKGTKSMCFEEYIYHHVELR